MPCKSGSATHPSWYYNLLNNPDCELSADGNGGRFFVQPTEGADHDRLFMLAEGRYSGYGKYAAMQRTLARLGYRG